MLKKSLILFCLFLPACVQSPEQIAAAKRLQDEQDRQTCINYGLKPGTDAFGNCRLQLDIARQQRENYYYSAPPPPYFYNGYYHYH